MTYSTAYKNIDKRAIHATKALVKNGFWKKDTTEEHKIQLCEAFIHMLSEIYEVPPPTFEFIDNNNMYIRTGGGVYTPGFNRITLFSKFSLVTLLHEFRHHLQYKKSGISLYKQDKEEDARAWSVSLFKLALPKSYENAINKGILHFE